MKKSTKVGDTINASPVPADAYNVVSYAWEAVDSPTAETGKGIALGASNSITVSANEEGKFIRVILTDDAGNTFTATTTSPVEKNNTATVTVSDEDGLQADGTGIVGDVLHLSYGSGLGVPSIITWYYDDVVTSTATGNATTMDGVLRLETGTNGKISGDDTKRYAGKYKVVITNSEGQTYTSNTVELVYDELEGSITSLNIW